MLGRLLREAEGHVASERDALFGRVLDVYLEVAELAVAVIPAPLDELRKKERLWELFRQLPEVPDDLAALAAALGPQAGLTAETALLWLAAFAAARTPVGRPGADSASGLAAV